MDILLIIIAAFWVSKAAREKGLASRPWVWRLVTTCIAFDIAGGMVSIVMTRNLYIAAAFGFFCAIGGVLLIKSRLDKIEPEKKKEHHWMDNIDQDN